MQWEVKIASPSTLPSVNVSSPPELILVIAALKHFLLRKTFSENNTDRVEVCETPLKAQQFRDGHRGGNIEVFLPHLIHSDLFCR